VIKGTSQPTLAERFPWSSAVEEINWNFLKNKESSCD
jgi:hypothetical protein